MAIDVIHDTLLPVTFPNSFGSDRHPSTIMRWIKTGVISRTTGKRIKLDARQIGGVWCTTKAAYLAFINELNGRSRVKKEAAGPEVSGDC